MSSSCPLRGGGQQVQGSKEGGDDARAGVAFGELIAVVDIQGVDGHAIGQGRPGGRDAAAILPQGGLISAKSGGGKLVDDGGGGGAPPSGSAAEGIEQAAPGLAARGLGQVLPGQVVDEIKHAF